MKICSHCGFKVLDNQRYCPKCGFSVNSINNEEKKLNSNWDKIDDTAKIEMPIIPDTPHKKTLNKKLIITTIILSVVVLSILTIILMYHNKGSEVIPIINTGGDGGNTGGDGGNTIDTGGDGGNTIDTGGGNTIDTGGGNTIDTGGGNTIDTGGGNTIDTGGGNTIDTGGNTGGNGGGNTGGDGGNTIDTGGNTGGNGGNTGGNGGNTGGNGGGNTDSNTGNSKNDVNYYIEKYKDRDFIFPDSDSVELTYNDLNSLSVEELFIARNEMFARYGYIFDDNSNLTKFFQSKKWYSPNSNYYGKLYSQVEEDNCKLIKTVEFTKLSHDLCPTITSDYVFPNSSSSLLSSSDISSKNNWEIIIAINEIYARYGFSFSPVELNNYFESKSWYTNTYYNNITLNDTEDKNLKLLAQEREKRITNALMHDLGK